MTTLVLHRLDQGAGAFEALVDQIESIVKATPKEAADYDYQATIAAAIRAFHNLDDDQRIGFLAGLAEYLTYVAEAGEPNFPMDRLHHRHLDQQQIDQVVKCGRLQDHLKVVRIAPEANRGES